MDWINVTQKLPNDGDIVLIWTKSNKPVLATYYAETPHGINQFVVKDVGAYLNLAWVTHWQSIPKPPINDNAAKQ